jgi:hypothetical protein
MAIFCPKGSRMLRGPQRRANTVYGGRAGILSKYFDLLLGTCSVQAETVSSSAFNSIPASSWTWQSYDKVCTAVNTLDVSGGELVPSGLGFGTLVVPFPNTAPICCSAYLVDSTITASGA